MQASIPIVEQSQTGERNMHEPSASIPKVDLSPFFITGDECGRKKAKETISKACIEYGFFQLVNHGVPLELMDQALELSKTFFNYSDEVKREFSPDPSSPVPAGYFKQPDDSHDKKEYLTMFRPEMPFNILPTNPPLLRKTLEELFKYFLKTTQLLEEILNECLGLPPNFFKVYNQDRSWDVMRIAMYPSATESRNLGLYAHKDASFISIVLQEDDVNGLEVYKDGEWMPIIPSKGVLIVNLGDIIQVLTNKKFQSPVHRVLRPKGRNRHSFAFFYNVEGDKWLEPLPEFTREIQVKPKYKGFYYKDYFESRGSADYHQPSRPEDIPGIAHYEI